MPEERRYDALFQRAPLGIAFVDLTGRVTAANPAFADLVPPAGPETGRPFPELEEPPGGRVAEAIRLAIQTGLPAPLRGAVLRPPAGAPPRVVDLEAVPIRGAHGRVAEVLLLVHDVTERTQERDRADLFYKSFLHSTNAIEVTDREGRLVDVNPAFEQIYGYSRAEVLGRKPNVVGSPRTSPETYRAMWKALLDPHRGHWTGELVNRSRDGIEHPVLLTIDAVRNDRNEITQFVGVAVDLRERRAWEQQAVHAERLASLGQLAAGVAHELNTPLANIMLVAESVQRKNADPWVRGRIATILQQTESAAKIVRGLLDFARRHEPQVREVDLIEVAHDAVAFLRGKQSEEVELVEETAPGPTRVLGDRDQLIQVFTNILNNSYEALENRGRIVVRVRPREGKALVEIEDDGPGIPPSILPHIFEPFFTTKSERNGTGLGLAICHGIVAAHGGAIAVETEVGHGTKFLLSFPLVAAPATGAVASARLPESAAARPAGDP